MGDELKVTITLRTGDEANVIFAQRCCSSVFQGSMAQLLTATLVCCIELHTVMPTYFEVNFPHSSLRTNPQNTVFKVTFFCASFIYVNYASQVVVA